LPRRNSGARNTGQPCGTERSTKGSLQSLNRGAITRAILNQLLQLAMQKRKYDLKLLEAAFESIFGAVLRSGEWKTLRVDAYDQANHTLHVVVCKAANAKNGLPTEMDLPILTELTHRSLSLLQNHRRARGARDDELLIPRNIRIRRRMCLHKGGREGLPMARSADVRRPTYSPTWGRPVHEEAVR